MDIQWNFVGFQSRDYSLQSVGSKEVSSETSMDCFSNALHFYRGPSKGLYHLELLFSESLCQPFKIYAKFLTFSLWCKQASYKNIHVCTVIMFDE